MHDVPINNVSVKMPSEAIRLICDECDRHDGAETGGRLVGSYSVAGENLTIEVSGVIEPGPAAQRTASSFFQDGDYQARVFRRVEAEHPEIEHLGNWHTHHVNGYPTLSPGDRATYRRIVNHGRHHTDFFYALLIVERTEEADVRYRARHFLLRRGDNCVYEIPSDRIEVDERPLVWPVAYGGARSDARAADQAQSEVGPSGSALSSVETMMSALFPQIKPFMTKRTGKVFWKGDLELIDESLVRIRVVNYRGAYHIAVQEAEEHLMPAVETLAERPFETVGLAVLEAERTLNRTLFTMADAGQ